MDTNEDLVNAYATLCNWAISQSTLSPSEAANLLDSGPRMARAFQEMVLPRHQVLTELCAIFRTRFPTDTEHQQLVMQANIQATSLCPHHMLPVEHVISYGYVTEPGSSVIGLSKFVRIAQLLAKRAVIQEQFTQDLIDVMTLGQVGVEKVSVAHEDKEKGLRSLKKEKYKIGEPVSKHVAAVVSSAHGCMTCRGVRSNSRTITSLFTGLLSSGSWKDDFYRGMEQA